MLAAASIGAIWTGVSPDTGVTAVLERLVQIEPKILFVDNAVMYNGKVHGSFAKVKDIVKGLKGLMAVVMFETVKGYEMNDSGLQFEGGNAWRYDAFLGRWYVSRSRVSVHCSVILSTASGTLLWQR
jgi:acetoacetyl-CoA synthetase